MTEAYAPRRVAQPFTLLLRGLALQLHRWDGNAADAAPLVALHGWMDVGASFQFLADALPAHRTLIALDWRGFGGSRGTPCTDSYWFPDYLGDVDAMLRQLSPDHPVDLLGHSMGANVAMVYAGVRPARIRRLMALEGFGMPPTSPAQAPGRYARWLDELAEPAQLRPYASIDEVAQRLRRNNPRLRADRALWLASHWAEQRDDGHWHLRADPAHKRVNPILYRAEEADACWRAITAPTLWLEGAQTDVLKHHGPDAHARFHARLAQVPGVQRVVLDDCGHMLHHDQPEAVARHIDAFLG
jgi:pimeloyl-ACP methyl ester carboxylesterase